MISGEIDRVSKFAAHPVRPNRECQRIQWSIVMGDDLVTVHPDVRLDCVDRRMGCEVQQIAKTSAAV
jgi:hypothetical protein